MDDFKYIAHMGRGGKETTHLQDKISSLRLLVDKENTTLDREAIKDKLDEVDFILSKYDVFFDRFTETIASIATVDFRYKFPEIPYADDFLYTLTGSLNMMLDVLKDRAIKKDLIHQLHSMINLKNILLIATDIDGKIIYINGKIGMNSDFDEKLLVGDSIRGIFDDYKVIENYFNEGKLPKDVKVVINWRGIAQPCSVSANVCNQNGKIEGLTYVIRFLPVIPN